MVLPTNMFWGVTIDAGKRYSQVVNQGFHLSMAALESNAKLSGQFVQVMLQHNSSEYLLCTLQHGKLLQQSLDLMLASGEQVSFSLNGSGVVHLTGYLLSEDYDDFDGESFSESDEEVPSLVSPGDKSLGGKRKASPSSQQSKKMKLLSNEEEDSEEEDDEDEFSDDFEDYFDQGDSDEDDEISEDDSSPLKGKSPAKLTAEVTPMSKKKENGPTTKVEKKTPQSADGKKTPKQTPKSTPSQAPKQGRNADSESQATPGDGESAKKKKKKKKKKKSAEGDSSLNNSASSAAESTPKKEPTPKKRVVAGGTVVEDSKIGNGPEAKPGKMVSLYYVGTLAKGGKRFDSCSDGKPFRFRLNQGEVIKGWDNGINGMKVGGKRRLTVPASQAYGNVKQGPIPPNSALIFDVELKAVT